MNAELSKSKLHDIAHMGMRASLGVIFIVHGFGKFGICTWYTSVNRSFN